MTNVRAFLCDETGQNCQGKTCGPNFCEKRAALLTPAEAGVGGSVTRRVPSMATLNHLKEREKIALKIVQHEEKARGKRFKPHIRGTIIAKLIFSDRVDAVLKARHSPK